MVANYFSRISSLQELVHFKSELRDLGLVYQDMECKALLEKICRIWSNVAYNDPVFVIVSRYDRLGPYVSLNYLFCAALALSVRFDHIKVKLPGKNESGQKWSIIIQNVLSKRGVTNCGHIWPSIANSDQFSTSATAKDAYDLWRHLVADTALYGIYWSCMTCCRQWWPAMFKNIKFESVSPLQGRIEGQYIRL